LALHALLLLGLPRIKSLKHHDPLLIHSWNIRAPSDIYLILENLRHRQYLNVNFLTVLVQALLSQGNSAKTDQIIKMKINIESRMILRT